MHNEVRKVKSGFDKANETIRAMQALQQEHSHFNFGISTTIFSQNLDDAENILNWARDNELDIVFNMVRFTDPMLGNQDLAEKCQPVGEEETRMREFFLDRVRIDPLLDGQNYIYMHYADMISNGYHRLAPCPFQTQGIMVNPDGGLFFCENSEVVGNVRDEDPEAIYFRADSLKHREFIKNEKCPTCSSPCQMNVSAIKQVGPYARFLVRAARENGSTASWWRRAYRSRGIDPPRPLRPLPAYFRQNAMRCHPSGRTIRLGSRLNAPTKRPL